LFIENFNHGAHGGIAHKEHGGTADIIP